jgi:hypothetical protein
MRSSGFCIIKIGSNEITEGNLSGSTELKTTESYAISGFVIL